MKLAQQDVQWAALQATYTEDGFRPCPGVQPAVVQAPELRVYPVSQLTHVKWVAKQSRHPVEEQGETTFDARLAPKPAAIGVAEAGACWHWFADVFRYHPFEKSHPVQVAIVVEQIRQFGTVQGSTSPFTRLGPYPLGKSGAVEALWHTFPFRYHKAAVLQPVQVVWVVLQSIQLVTPQGTTIPVAVFGPEKFGIVGLLVAC